MGTVYGVLLALAAYLLAAQASYPVGFIPYREDCATATLGLRTMCHDDTGVYIGPFLPWLAKEKLNGSVMLLEFSGADGAADIEYLFTDRGRATSTNTTSGALNDNTRQILPGQAGFLKNLHCRISANPHAGATFTYTVYLNDVATPLSCVATENDATCQNTATVVYFTANSAVNIVHDDSTLTDGTQVTACTAEAVY